VWSDLVVVTSPGLNDDAGIADIPEPVLVKAAIPKPGVEALHERVLSRFAWLDIAQLHAGMESSHGSQRKLR